MLNKLLHDLKSDVQEKAIKEFTAFIREKTDLKIIPVKIRKMLLGTVI